MNQTLDVLLNEGHIACYDRVTCNTSGFGRLIFSGGNTSKTAVIEPKELLQSSSPYG